MRNRCFQSLGLAGCIGARDLTTFGPQSSHSQPTRREPPLLHSAPPLLPLRPRSYSLRPRSYSLRPTAAHDPATAPRPAALLEKADSPFTSDHAPTDARNKLSSHYSQRTRQIPQTPRGSTGIAAQPTSQTNAGRIGKLPAVQARRNATAWLFPCF